MLDTFKNQVYKGRIFLRTALQPLLDKQISTSPAPVFIVGCGHSGTTLLVGLVGKHPSFHFIPFESYIFRPHRKFSEIKNFFKEAEQQAAGKRILEKTPRHVSDIERIFRIFPDARIIAMVRDGRDVACSMLKREIPLLKGIRRWRRDCQSILDVQNDSRVHVVKYEDLVTSQQAILDGIFRFLGEAQLAFTILESGDPVEWNYSKTTDINEDTEEHAKRRKKHLERRKEQINKSIYDDTKKWEKTLNAEQIAMLDAHAEDMLRAWGYK